MQSANMEKAEVLTFLQKDPGYLRALLLLRLSAKLSVNFLTKSVALTVFLLMANVSL